MKAVYVEGTPDEIAAFVKSTGIAVSGAATAPPAAGELADPRAAFIDSKVQGNTEKHRLASDYINEVETSAPLRVRIGIKENGEQNDYLKGRLTTVDEDRIGDVVYVRPSSSMVTLRLPVESIDGFEYATRVDSKRPPEVFAKVRHQVRVKLVNDDAVAEAVKLTKLAVEKALSDEW